MTCLLDVNVLLALGYEEHIHRARAARWLNHLQTHEKSLTLATCSITELGFVRVASGKAGFAEDVKAAREDLGRLKAGWLFTFLDDGLSVDCLPRWVERSKHVTDGHLLALATLHQAPLVTLDAGIPGALLITEQPEDPAMVREPPARYGIAA